MDEVTNVLKPVYFLIVDITINNLSSLDTMAHELDSLLDSLAFELDSLDKQDFGSNKEVHLRMSCIASVMTTGNLPNFLEAPSI